MTTPQITITTLKCKRCNQNKPLQDYDRTYFGKHGYDIYCHPCHEAINNIAARTTEKQCRQCKTIKPVTEFDKTASGRDGYFRECISCRDENFARQRHRKHHTTWDGTTYRCNICHQEKPSYEFIKHTFHNKPRYYCRLCISTYHRQKKQRYEDQRNQNGYPLTKRCKTCGTIQPSDRFNLDRTKKDGFADICITCTTKYEQQRQIRIIQRLNAQKKKPKQKECTICHTLKPIPHFDKNKTNIDGLSDKCKPCVKALRQENIQIWTTQNQIKTKKGIIITEKTCRICKRRLPIDMFSKGRHYKQGYYTYCLDCHKKIEKKLQKQWEHERNKKQFEFSLSTKTTKKCNICNQELPYTVFYRKKALKDGHSLYCKDCEEAKKKAHNEYLKKRGFPKELIPKEKHCKKCNTTYPQTLFRRNATLPDGLDTYCKNCKTEYYKEYQARPEIIQKHREYRQRPEVKKRRLITQKRYASKPESQEKIRAYKREYDKQPHIKARKKAYAKKYQKRDYVKKKKAAYDRQPERRKKRIQSTTLWQRRQREKRKIEKNHK